jgi:site-specific recombinase XerD
LTPLGATVLIADKRGTVQSAGTLLSWGGGRSLQTVLCTVKGTLAGDEAMTIGRCRTDVAGCMFEALQNVVTGSPVKAGADLEITRVDKHAAGGAGWHLRDCAAGATWTVGEIADGTPVFLPGVAHLDDTHQSSGVLLAGYVAGSTSSAAGEGAGRFLVGGTRARVLAGAPVFARRGGAGGGLLLIGLVDGTALTSAGLQRVIPIAQLLESSQTWKRAALGALPSLTWAGSTPGEYRIHERIAAFLADNAASGRFAKATIEARRQDLLNLDRWARSRGLDVVTLGDEQLALYFEERAAQGRRESTLVRERGSIERFYEYLVGMGSRSAPVSSSMKVEGAEAYRPRSVLTVREVRRVLDFDGGPADTALRDRALVELMYGTGLRNGELAALRIEQLDLRRGVVRVPARRKGARELPLNEPVRKALREYLRTLGPERSLAATASVFRNPRGLPFTRQTIAKILAERAAAAGIKKDVTGMTLRNSAAAHLLERGVDRKGVAQFLGLGSVSALHSYLPSKPHLSERRVS